MRKGQRCPPETRAKISAANKGRTFTSEHRANLSAAHTGVKLSAKHRARISAANAGNQYALGYRHTLEARVRMSAAHRGNPNCLGHRHTPKTKAKIAVTKRGLKASPETRAKLSATLKGNQRTLGYKHTPETLVKMSVAQKGKRCGAKHPFWRGGISREPYGWEFNEELREAIRQRDGYTCQLCDVSQSRCATALSVHHVNYQKRDNSEGNLVTLCHSCHSRTNTGRGHWTTFFQEQALKRREETNVFMLHISPSRHRLPATPTSLDKYLHREYPDRKLFTYLHLTTRNWVVAEWCNKMRGTAMEVLILGRAPRLLDRDQAAELRQRLRAPANRGAIRQNLDAIERGRLRKEADDAAELKDATARMVRDAHPGPAGGTMLWVPRSVGGGR